MSSPPKIDPNTINPNFPSAGQENNSQGFRDNFASIQTNFARAQEELDLMLAGKYQHRP